MDSVFVYILEVISSIFNIQYFCFTSL